MKEKHDGAKNRLTALTTQTFPHIRGEVWAKKHQATITQTTKTFSKLTSRNKLLLNTSGGY